MRAAMLLYLTMFFSSSTVAGRHRPRVSTANRTQPLQSSTVAVAGHLVLMSAF